MALKLNDFFYLIKRHLFFIVLSLPMKLNKALNRTSTFDVALDKLVGAVVFAMVKCEYVAFDFEV